MSMWEPGLKDLMENVMIEMYCPEQDEVEELDIEFRYYEPDEFADPAYHIYLEGEFRGGIGIKNGVWYGALQFESMYSVKIFEAVAAKLRELNEQLARSKKWF